MELRHLRYALAIAEERHFTRAAARLGIGQPPLSQQIKLLEQELGVQLFHRQTRGVELTDAGEAFMPLAQAAVAAAEQAVQAARRAARGEIGALTIGFTSSASFNPLVPRIIGRFRERHPDLTIRLVEQTTIRLLEAMGEGSVDVAFLRPALGDTDGLVTRRLPDEDLWVALPARHRLAGNASIELVDLAGDPFILYPRSNGRLLYDSIIAACRNAGFSPRIAQEAPQMASTVNLVAAGVGVALVPESMRQLHAHGVVYARIAGDGPKAQLVVAHRRDGPLPPAVRNFMSCVTGDD
ncbi:LysR family transcriptional regulator [Sphingomonas jeddahensis]|uniref:Hca operon transcriptional activator n=1 Tax=Sphingomonas jeddahensis TaxID=1915074 RepID=A0A1V2EXG3_9SPHN|nr:LysR family transcriptional regulator [Sphingomonas jeddahensis]ONF96844.1 Hca operon transcriptional activator [Sphingomonas jeddahensis]